MAADVASAQSVLQLCVKPSKLQLQLPSVCWGIRICLQTPSLRMRVSDQQIIFDYTTTPFGRHLYLTSSTGPCYSCTCSHFLINSPPSQELTSLSYSGHIHSLATTHRCHYQHPSTHTPRQLYQPYSLIVSLRFWLHCKTWGVNQALVC